MALPILLPIAAGLLMLCFRTENRKLRLIFAGCVALANSLLLGFIALRGDVPAWDLIKLTETLTLTLHVDRATRVFALLIAFLWPLATLYAFEYMEHEHRENTFFAYYLMSYGVTAGIAMSANVFTLYVFYELLTLVTLPLVVHKMDNTSVHAGNKYLYYSISGAALAFIGVMFTIAYSGESILFTQGGCLDPELVKGNETLLRWIFVMTFMGFGVKAAIFPLHDWLPSVSVAPTPVTALLHAVAVVKAGAFAVIRLIYFSFGTELLAGTWAQWFAIGIAAFTIVFGSAMAVKEKHFKRRLVYSTVSNLSYIVLAASLMTNEGLTAAYTHMLFHGIMKILLFFCAGAVLVKTGREYVQQLRGMGKKMPFTCALFTLSGAALVGVPPLCGFFSKWRIATAAAACGSIASYIGVISLIISAVLTAVYIFTVVVYMWFLPYEGEPCGNSDPGWRMKLPMAIIACAVVLGGFCVNFLL